ncbi:MAG: hypothetical protein ABI388_08785, partial [Bacteroidia bacterium]
MKTQPTMQSHYQGVALASAKSIINKLNAIILFLMISLVAVSQKNTGAIKISLSDKITKEGIPFANIIVYKEKVQVAVGTTDVNGDVMIKPIASGKYNIKAAYVGY